MSCGGGWRVVGCDVVEWGWGGVGGENVFVIRMWFHGRVLLGNKLLSIINSSIN